MNDKLLFVLRSFREDLHPRESKGSKGGGRFKKKDSPSTPNSWIDNIDVTQLPPPDILSTAIENNESSAGEDFVMTGSGFYSVDTDGMPNPEEFEDEDGNTDDDALGEAEVEWLAGAKDKLREKLAEEIKRLIENSDGVGVRRGLDSLNSLLTYGRVGNVHTMPSREDPQGLSEEDLDEMENRIQTFGMQDYRTDLEDAFFGRAAGDSKEDRPAYGYVRSNVIDKSDFMKQYGEIEFIVKPEVLAKRAFVTVGDSGAHNMDEEGEFRPKLVPSPYADPKGYSVSLDGSVDPHKRFVSPTHYRNPIPQNLFDLGDVGDLDTYMEVQIVGGLRLQDIERIEIYDTDGAVEEMIDWDVVEKLEKMGIKVDKMY